MQMIIVMLVASLIVLVCLAYRRHRQSLFRSCADLLKDTNKVIDISRSVTDPAGLGHVSGRFAGSDVSLTLEKSESKKHQPGQLWLHITLYRREGSTGSLDILIRPQVSDTFSPGWQWRRAVTPLKSWPQHARYMSRDRPPILQHLDSDVRTLFADQQVKALLILPESVRLTCLLQQSANREWQPVDSAEVAALTRQLQTLVMKLDAVFISKVAA